mgnify:CR=1 FL=1
MTNSQMPAIIKETSSGTVCYRIQDAMFMRREITLSGEITQESASACIMQLQYLAAQSADEEITLYINSSGGDVTAGLALYDVMQAVKCPIHTVCMGMAASMGAILFTAGDIRDIMPHARIMIHDPRLSQGVTGDAMRLNDISKDLLEMRRVLGLILARHTKKKLQEIFKATQKDTWFNAQESVNFVLADKIIYEMRGASR